MVLGFVAGAISLYSQYQSSQSQREASKIQAEVERQRRERAVRNQIRQQRIALASSTINSIGAGVGAGSSIVQSARSGIRGQTQGNITDIRRSGAAADQIAQAQDRAQSYQNFCNLAMSSYNLYSDVYQRRAQEAQTEYFNNYNNLMQAEEANRYNYSDPTVRFDYRKAGDQYNKSLEKYKRLY